MNWEIENALGRAKEIESKTSVNGGFYNTADEVHIISLAKGYVSMEKELFIEKEDFNALDITHKNLLKEYSRLAEAGGKLKKEINELKSQADAAYNHANIFNKKLICAQSALEKYPAVVTKMLNGYGIQVNEHQVDSYLHDLLSQEIKE
jgi:hypothetical protein